MKKITRRDALKGATAGFMIVSPQVAFSYQANSQVSLGLIGTGSRGQYVAGMFVNDPRTKLTAICDIRPERIDQAKTVIPGADKVPAYKDLHELLNRQDIDAVYIATPVWLHPEHFEAAVNAHKNIYCEKPAGADVAGVKRLMRAAEKNPGKTMQFGFQQRFSPEYLAAEKILRDGSVGDLTLMYSFWITAGNDFPGVPTPKPQTEMDRIIQWARWKATSGDFIVEQDCHGVDVLNWFAKAHPETALGDGGRYRRQYGDNYDHYNISYRYPGGLRGWLLGTQLPANHYADVKEQFFGSLGSLETNRRYYKWFKTSPRNPVTVEAKREITIDAVEAFLNSVLTGKPINMVQIAAESTLTSILGRMAGEQKREVSWEEMMRSA
jgi:predicted dehydrogenase